jgi:hypothetical protein
VKPPKKRPQYPSETTQARAARGRHRVQVELTTEARDRLETLADERDTSKSAVVEGLIMGPSEGTRRGKEMGK